jgi:hypothetical protein
MWFFQHQSPEAEEPRKAPRPYVEEFEYCYTEYFSWVALIGLFFKKGVRRQRNGILSRGERTSDHMLHR